MTARRRKAGTALLALWSLGSCAAVPPQPVAAPEYVIGAPYQMGSAWSYPREDFGLTQTGLAAVTADRRAGRRTANGEIYDPRALMAAHRTLQLPAILYVTNLENGLRLRVRVNDRGPAQPGRLLEVSPRVAELLGMSPGGTSQVAIAIDEDESRILAASLPHREPNQLHIASAPRDVLQGEVLPDLPGTRTKPVQPRSGAPSQSFSTVTPAAAPPAELSPVAVRTAARPGRLLIETGHFNTRAEAQRQASRIGGRVEASGTGRRAEFRVRLGPFQTVSEADTTLETLLRSGVSDAKILVD
ncbi:RlpA-like double-psi beta-barrel domain-containing protein [Pseudoroseomonas globiformis]|uniref:Endolytic peptidoglycan transglycosylase RlpA n=1 Tax=Teichococcus globiformis TaxID=2307229 RepID=A0ABV7G031_9PROT